MRWMRETLVIFLDTMSSKEEKKKYDQTKRKGRRSTILTSTSGISDELELAKKTLLGG